MAARFPLRLPSSVPTLYTEEDVLSRCVFSRLCQKLTDRVYMRLPLGSLLCSVELMGLLVFQYHTVLIIVVL